MRQSSARNTIKAIYGEAFIFQYCILTLRRKNNFVLPFQHFTRWMLTPYVSEISHVCVFASRPRRNWQGIWAFNWQNIIKIIFQPFWRHFCQHLTCKKYIIYMYKTQFVDDRHQYVNLIEKFWRNFSLFVVNCTCELKKKSPNESLIVPTFLAKLTENLCSGGFFSDIFRLFN